jgi:hypothetical protein
MRSAHDPGGTAGQRRAQARAAKSPRWSAERRGVSCSRETPGVESTTPACRSQARAGRAYGTPRTGASHAPGRLRRSATPSSGWQQKMRIANSEKGKRKNREEEKWGAARLVGRAKARPQIPPAPPERRSAVPTPSTLSTEQTAWAHQGVYARLRGRCARVAVPEFHLYGRRVCPPYCTMRLRAGSPLCSCAARSWAVRSRALCCSRELSACSIALAASALIGSPK